MINLLGPKLRLAIIGNLVLLVFLGVDFAREILFEGYSPIGNSITVFTSIRITLFIVTASIGVLFLKPVWRSVWRLPVIGKLLSEHIFPDLNGKWVLETKSNWPIIESRKEAAETREAVVTPPRSREEAAGLLRVDQFGVEIDQRWQRTTVTVHTTGATPLRTSRTLFVELIPAADDSLKRIAWIFHQRNEVIRDTDEDNFWGAALLDVESKDQLSGYIWTNRAWRKGLNTAGTVTLRRKT